MVSVGFVTLVISLVGPTSGDWWIRLVSCPLIPTSPGTFPGQTSITTGSDEIAGVVANTTAQSHKKRATRVMV